MTYLKFLWIGAMLLMSSACSNQPLTTASPETGTSPVFPTVTAQVTDTPVLVSPTPALETTQPPTTLTDTLPPPTTETVSPLETATPEGTSILGEHVVRAGETLSCIGRGYGVLPQAIAEANGMQLTDVLHVGQALKIPAIQWTSIPGGPVCAVQFASPFPGLPVAGGNSQPVNTPPIEVPDTPGPTPCSYRCLQLTQTAQAKVTPIPP